MGSRAWRSSARSHGPSQSHGRTVPAGFAPDGRPVNSGRPNARVVRTRPADAGMPRGAGPGASALLVASQPRSASPSFTRGPVFRSELRYMRSPTRTAAAVVATKISSERIGSHHSAVPRKTRIGMPTGDENGT